MNTSAITRAVDAWNARMGSIILTGVDSITRPLSHIENELRAHASQTVARAAELRVQAEAMLDESYALEAEAKRATKVAGNIAKVLA